MMTCSKAESYAVNLFQHLLHTTFLLKDPEPDSYRVQEDDQRGRRSQDDDRIKKPITIRLSAFALSMPY